MFFDQIGKVDKSARINEQIRIAFSVNEIRIFAARYHQRRLLIGTVNRKFGLDRNAGRLGQLLPTASCILAQFAFESALKYVIVTGFKSSPSSPAELPLSPAAHAPE